MIRSTRWANRLLFGLLLVLVAEPCAHAQMSEGHLAPKPFSAVAKICSLFLNPRQVIVLDLQRYTHKLALHSITDLPSSEQTELIAWVNSVHEFYPEMRPRTSALLMSANVLRDDLLVKIPFVSDDKLFNGPPPSPLRFQKHTALYRAFWEYAFHTQLNTAVVSFLTRLSLNQTLEILEPMILPLGQEPEFAEMARRQEVYKSLLNAKVKLTLWRSLEQMLTDNDPTPVIERLRSVLAFQSYFNPERPWLASEHDQRSAFSNIGLQIGARLQMLISHELNRRSHAHIERLPVLDLHLIHSQFLVFLGFLQAHPTETMQAFEADLRSGIVDGRHPWWDLRLIPLPLLKDSTPNLIQEVQSTKPPSILAPRRLMTMAEFLNDVPVLNLDWKNIPILGASQPVSSLDFGLPSLN